MGFSGNKTLRWTLTSRTHHLLGSGASRGFGGWCSAETTPGAGRGSAVSAMAPPEVFRTGTKSLGLGDPTLIKLLIGASGDGV